CPPRKRGRWSRLSEEFAEFYASERKDCPWAPANPRRAFNLAVKTLWSRYRKVLTAPEFLSVIYLTLGVREGQPRGLFQTFAPAKYTGGLPLEKHFLNLFKSKLLGRLHREVKPRRRRPRPGDPWTFRNQPAPALVHPDERLDLADAVALLPSDEREVIRL